MSKKTIIIPVIAATALIGAFLSWAFLIRDTSPPANSVACIERPAETQTASTEKTSTDGRLKELTQEFGGTYAGDGTSKTLDRGTINWCEE